MRRDQVGPETGGMRGIRAGRRWAPVLALVALACGVQAQPTEPSAPAGGQGAEVTTPAPAIPTADQLLVERPLQEALDESKQKGRILLVEIAGNEQRQRDALRRYESPLVRRWVAQHALGVLLTDREMIKTLTESELNPGPDADPLLFRNGQYVRIFGTGVPPKKSRLRGPARPDESFLGLVLKLDWTLRGADEGGDVGAGAPGAWPPARTWAGVTDDSAVGIPAGPAVGAGGLPALALVLARHREAQDAVKGGGLENFRRATGLYTWLWEACAAADADARSAAGPVFWPALWLVVAPEMEALAGVHPPARERWKALRREMLPVLDVRDPRALFAFMVLSRVIGDQEDNFRFLDDALNDVDAGRLMPRSDRALLELILPACHWLPSGAPDQALRLTKLDERAQRAIARVPEHAGGGGGGGGGVVGARARVSAAWAWLLDLERARSYTTLLARDQDAPGAALASGWSPEAREAALIAALMLGEARASQRDLAKGCARERELLEALPPDGK